MNEKSMYDQCLACLNDIYETMMSPEYRQSLDTQPEAVREKAGRQFSEVEKERAEFESSKIGRIINSLQKNAPALEEGIAQVRQAKQNLGNVKAFLSVAVDFLSLIDGIVNRHVMTSVSEIEYPCGEPGGCDQKVRYKRISVPMPSLMKWSWTGTKVVYLTCPRGHTNPYTVET